MQNVFLLAARVSMVIWQQCIHWLLGHLLMQTSVTLKLMPTDPKPHSLQWQDRKGERRNLFVVVVVVFFVFFLWWWWWWWGGGGKMAHQDYFTHFEPHQSLGGAKTALAELFFFMDFNNGNRSRLLLPSGNIIFVSSLALNNSEDLK